MKMMSGKLKKKLMKMMIGRMLMKMKMKIMKILILKQKICLANMKFSKCQCLLKTVSKKLIVLNFLILLGKKFKCKFDG